MWGNNLSSTKPVPWLLHRLDVKLESPALWAVCKCVFPKSTKDLVASGSLWIFHFSSHPLGLSFYGFKIKKIKRFI